MFEAEVLLTILIGLVIFLFGIENFSSEIQKAAGNKFKEILQKATKNKYRATLFGTLTTAILNSSTATTIIAVGLINAGLISFAQSLGIIFGANIGSTITAQLVALKLTAFAPYLIIVGFIMSFIKKTKFLGKSFFFFGMVFFGLNLVSNSMAHLSNDQNIVNYFLLLSNIPLAILAGFIFTAVVNSSALTIGIIIILSSGGLISLSQGIPLLLGANLGTTITTLIASSKMNLYAKRTAIAHLMFNVIGVILMFPFIGVYGNLISYLGGSVEQQIANAHTIFNLLAATLFLVLIKPFKRIVEAIVRGNEEEILLKTKYLTKKLPLENEEAFLLIEKEVKYLAEISSKMFSMTKNIKNEMSDKDSNRLLKMGILNDTLSDFIAGALFEIGQRKLTENEAKKVILLVRISNTLEQIGDLSEDLGGLPSTLKSKGRNLSLESSTKKLEKVHLLLEKSLEEFGKSFSKNKLENSLNNVSSKDIPTWINEGYNAHIQFFKGETYHSGSLFVEALSIIENAVLKIKELLFLGGKYFLVNEKTKHLNNNKN